MIDDVVKQLTTRYVLHDHENIRWRTDNLVSTKKQ